MNWGIIHNDPPFKYSQECISIGLSRSWFSNDPPLPILLIKKKSHMGQVKGQLAGVTSLLPSGGAQGLNSGCQPCCQTPWCTEPSWRPFWHLLKMQNDYVVSSEWLGSIYSLQNSRTPVLWERISVSSSIKIPCSAWALALFVTERRFWTWKVVL